MRRRPLSKQESDSSFGFATLIASGASAVVWAWVGGSFSESQAWAIATVWLGTFCLAFGSLSGRCGPVLFTFWPFVVVTMGVAPLAQNKLGRYPRSDDGLSAYYADAQLLVLAVGLIHAFFYFRSVRQDDVLDKPEFGRAHHLLGASRRLGVAVGLGLAAFPLSLASGTSLGSRFQSRDDLISAYSQAGIAYAEGQSIQLALLKTLPTALAVASAMLAAYEVANRRHSGVSSVPLFTASTVAIAAFTVFANPLSNGRYAAFSAVLAVAFCAIRLQSKVSRVAIALGLLVGLMTVYPAAATFKNATASDRIESGTAAFATVDFDGMQQTANALYYTDSVGHTNGMITLSAGLFFVPRAVWPGKLLPSSYLTTEARGYGPLNLSQPLWSEAYLDFGIFGALGVFGLLGHLSGRVDRMFHRRRTSGPWVLLTAVLAGVQVGFLRGPMGAIMVYTAALVFFVSAAVWWSQRPIEDRRPSGRVEVTRFGVRQRSISRSSVEPLQDS